MNTSNPGPFPEPPSETSAPRWAFARKLLLGAGILLTLLVLFNTEENWRGKRAWERCRRDLEAKGEVLDWAAYIPAPIPDDQNAFKAPKMEEWFVRDRSGTGKANSQPLVRGPSINPGAGAPQRLDRRPEAAVLARVEVLPAKDATNTAPVEGSLVFGDPSAAENAGHQLMAAMHRSACGAVGCVFVAHTLDDIRPVRMRFSAGRIPSSKELEAFLFSRPNDLAGYVRLEAYGTNAFRICLRDPVYAAADYLAWTEPDTAALEMMRQALERPLAQIEGPSEPPYERPIPNFVTIRTVVQAVSQRAQCELLLGHSEAALRELTLIHDLCRLLDTKPVTLVSAMINVAVSGLYSSVVQDGLRLQAWSEPQLVVLERQLHEIDLLPPIADSLKTERAGCCRTFEITPMGKLPSLFAHPGGGTSSLWQSIKDGDFLALLVPRGWVFQNMAVLASSENEFLAGLDASNRLVHPQALEEVSQRLTVQGNHFSPYTRLANIATPNLMKACNVAAFRQTRVNQTRVVCGLERYRLVHQEYPETLDALVPQFAESLPGDLFGGKLLRYRRSGPSSFLLYSIGWDEKDDGGVPLKPGEKRGDWVWQ